MRDYLNPKTSAKDVAEIQKALEELIRRGAWPNWEVEFNEAVSRCPRRRKLRHLVAESGLSGGAGCAHCGVADLAGGAGKGQAASAHD